MRAKEQFPSKVSVKKTASQTEFAENLPRVDTLFAIVRHLRERITTLEREISTLRTQCNRVERKLNRDKESVPMPSTQPRDPRQTDMFEYAMGLKYGGYN